MLLFPEKTIAPFLNIINNINKLIGLGKYFIFVFMMIEGFHLLFNFNIPNFYNRMFGITSLILVLLAFIHLRLIFIENAYFMSTKGIGGGLYGYYIARHLNNYFGLTGAYLFLIALGLIALLFATDLSFLYLFSFLFKKIVIGLNRLISIFPINRMTEKSMQKRESRKSIKIYSSNTEEIKRKPEPIFRKDILSKEGKKSTSAIQGRIDFTVKSDEEEKRLSSYYIAPSITLLNEPKKEYKDRDLEKIKENIALLQRTLDNFNIQGEVIGATQGPTVTRYEIQPAPGVKVSKITNLSNDIALAFASPSVRIETPIPGKNAIGIEVPNKEKNIVFLREIIESKDYQSNYFILPIVLGKDIGGKNIIADLVELPHLLIAGSTGSGKSVCLNTIILSLIYRFGPEMVKFLIIDPKRVELNIYNGIPHLITPIVTNTKKVDKVLNWAISEMERRFKIFAEVGVRNLKGYHDYIKSIKSEETNLPYIVFIIDELADLMLSSPVKVEEALCRLAQMTRATGIHLIIATQRPSVDIITGSIKINFPSRIAFAVSTQVDSRTILDVNGAEKLLGNGDMLFSPINAPKPIRAQGAFVSEKEIKEIVSFLVKNNLPPDYNENIIEHLQQKEGEGEGMGDDEEDELFEDAVDTIITNNQASISILQRKLRIGYTRAARLIDLMEKRGLVGPYDGRNPRKILLSKEDFFSDYKNSNS
jgi:S-DNA-T family DNA segregation ATPase FtsK/SpoIIIE